MPFFITQDCIGCTACKTICPSSAVTGEKKELHSVRPDLCIDCGACGRVCPSRAVTDNFGRVVSRIPKKEWERPFINLELCMACNICLDACPKNALDMELQKGKDPHAYPWLAREKDCMACGFCAGECPVDAISMEKRAGE